MLDLAPELLAKTMHYINYHDKYKPKHDFSNRVTDRRLRGKGRRGRR